MALQLRRGTNAQRLTITPANGELIFVTDYASAGVGTLWVGDGTTVGGVAGDTNTTYDFNATTSTGGANLNLVGSNSTTDTVKLTDGGGITATYTSGTVITLGSTATSANTANAIVSRDASGNFSAGTISATTINSTNLSATTVTATTEYITGTLASRVVATATRTSTTQFALTTADATKDVMKCLINMVQGSNFHCCEALILRTGSSTALITIYGELFNNSRLANFDANVSGGVLQLLVTPASATSTVFTVLRDSLA